MHPKQSEYSLDESVKQKSRLIQTENGFAYRDLNKNGKLDIYEDPRQPITSRVEDLLSQMTLAEKAGMLFALSFHHGDLNFKDKAKAEILALLEKVPTIVVIYLDRPAVIPEISAAAYALLADFGASDTAVLNVIFGKAQPEGKLPFELPASMEAVRAQRSDVPHDSKDPLYLFGFGLSYAANP